GRGIGTHVRITDEQVKPPVFSVIGQRLVTCVDDGAIELHPLVDVVHDMIRTLAKLEIHPCFQSRRLEIKRQWIGLTDAAGAREDLSRRQESKKCPGNWWCELRLPLHQIILMTTKRGASVVIDVIFDERNAILRAQSNQ